MNAAYDMSEHQRVIATDGRISGTWVVLKASSKAGREREFIVKPNDVTIYDETRTYGRVMYTPDLTAWVRDGVVEIPRHMVSDGVAAEVEEVRDELVELLQHIAAAFAPTPERWITKMDAERERQVAHGFDDRHDDEHGVAHLADWAIDYARRGKVVAASTMVRQILRIVTDSRETSRWEL